VRSPGTLRKTTSSNCGAKDVTDNLRGTEIRRKEENYGKLIKHFTVNVGIHHEADHGSSFIRFTEFPALINTKHVIFLHIKSRVDALSLNFLQIVRDLSKE
jgi:hypothetical protein